MPKSSRSNFRVSVRGEVEVVVFPKSYALFKDLILKDTPLLFKGKVNIKADSGGADTEPKKVRDDGSEAKTFGTKAIILDEIRKI